MVDVKKNDIVTLISEEISHIWQKIEEKTPKSCFFSFPSVLEEDIELESLFFSLLDMILAHVRTHQL